MVQPNEVIITKTACLTQCVGDPGYFYIGQPARMIISTHVDDMAGYGEPAALPAFERAVETEVELEKLGNQLNSLE